MVNYLRALRKLVTMAAWRKRHPWRRREWINENREHVSKYERDYLKKNAARKKQTRKTWRRLNRLRVNKSNKAWRLANPESYKKQRDKSTRKALAAHPHLMLRKRLRTLLLFHFSGKRGLRPRTHDIVGCSHQFFAGWVRSLFQPGMSFSNRAEWHLDHIFPISCCGKNESNILLANNYRNIRPMWKHDNCEKTDRLTEDSIVAAFLCGITEIHIKKPWQATEELLTKARKIGFNVVNHCTA